MTGARIINRRPAMNAGWLDALDIQREGFKRSEDLRRTTGVSGKQIARETADDEFRIWWDYHGADESSLSRAEAKKEWLKGFRGRGWGSHNPPEESLQEKSWREWQENFARVSADPESASITDLMRAIGYLDKVRSSIQRHAWEQGKKADANVIAGYENEEQYYQRLIEQKQGRRNASSLEDQMRKRIRQRLAEGWSLEKIGDRTVWHMYGHLYRIKDGILYVKTARGDEAFEPAIGQPNAARVTQRDVDYAAASYHNNLMQYGENNMATQRAEWKYRELQRAYAEQQAKRKASK